MFISEKIISDLKQVGHHGRILISDIILRPTKISDNGKKRAGSFLFSRMDGKAYGTVIEITKTPDSVNQVVSTFPIDQKTYKKLIDISGGTAPK